MSPAEQLAYNRQVLQPIQATVRGRVSFYAQQVTSWRELEQTKSPYRTPEQSRKLLSCQSKVSALHNAYTELQIQLFNDRPQAGSREKFVMLLQHLQNRDYAYLEGECPTLLKQLSKLAKQVVTPNIFSSPMTFPGSAPSQASQPDFSHYPQDDTSYEQAQSGTNLNLPPSTEPPQNYEERYQLAQSLLKQGREQEARSMLSDLLASVRQTGNRALQIKILKKISEVEFALRNYLPARILYEELQQLNAPFDQQHLAALQSVDTQRDKVDAYAALLLSSLTSNPEQDGFTVVQQAQAFIQTYPGSSLRANAENLAGKAEQEAEQWFRGLLRQFDQLVAKDRSNDALALLDKVPLDILPLDKQEIIQQRKNSLVVESPLPASVQTELPVSPAAVMKSARPEIRENSPQENQEQAGTASIEETTQPDVAVAKEEKSRSENKEKTSSPPRQTADTALQEKWDKAEAAFLAAEYDKAIALFTDLQNTSLGAKALKKVEKASEAAGQETRKKAASFFLRANNATDPKVKKQHLLSSKTLLEDILQKYPLAGLDDTVKRNLSRVDKELAALDPTPFN
ncbi:MAG: hypothetical protein D3908_00885 [Candidatus Electrothrix sp. AUS4]|nr:hypothetical protein [Candidatus Electrothrix sp. AUS4]